MHRQRGSYRTGNCCRLSSTQFTPPTMQNSTVSSLRRCERELGINNVLFIMPCRLLLSVPCSTTTVYFRVMLTIGRRTHWSASQPPEVAETATKPSPVPPQRHLLGGCTVDRARTYHICTVYPVDLPSPRADHLAIIMATPCLESKFLCIGLHVCYRCLYGPLERM